MNKLQFINKLNELQMLLKLINAQINIYNKEGFSINFNKLLHLSIYYINIYKINNKLLININHKYCQYSFDNINQHSFCIKNDYTILYNLIAHYI